MTRFDRIPGPLAFGCMAAFGVLMGWALLSQDVLQKLEARYGATQRHVTAGLAGLVALAVILIITSRAQIAQREAGIRRLLTRAVDFGLVVIAVVLAYFFPFGIILGTYAVLSRGAPVTERPVDSSSLAPSIPDKPTPAAPSASAAPALRASAPPPAPSASAAVLSIPTASATTSSTTPPPRVVPNVAAPRNAPKCGCVPSDPPVCAQICARRARPPAAVE